MLRTIMKVLAAVAAAAAVGSLAHAGEVLALTGVNVVSVRDGKVARDRTVVIENGRISAVLAPGARPPASARRVELSGRYVSPGLIDSHVHLPLDAFAQLIGAPPPAAADRELALAPYLAGGVTGLVVMSGGPDLIALRDAIARGEVLGPSLALASPMVSGAKPVIPPPVTIAAASAANGAALVDRFKAEGYDLVKTREDLPPEVAAAIVAAGAKAGLPVAGHMPNGLGSLSDYFAAPNAGAAHLYDLLYPEPYRSGGPSAAAALLRERRGFVVSTLVVHANNIAKAADHPATLKADCARALDDQLFNLWRSMTFEPNSSAEVLRAEMVKHRGLVVALVKDGVPLLAGSDAGAPTIGPGCSLHDELDLLVAAGLTPRQALAAATLSPAGVFARFKNNGEVAVGRRADLVVTRADPTRDVRALRDIEGVVLAGQWLDRAELDRRLKAAQKR